MAALFVVLDRLELLEAVEAALVFELRLVDDPPIKAASLLLLRLEVLTVDAMDGVCLLFLCCMSSSYKARAWVALKRVVLFIGMLGMCLFVGSRHYLYAKITNIFIFFPKSKEIK